MSKEKIKNSIWSVLIEGIKIYFSNIDKFVLYMLFPVFGQVLGLVLIFGLTLGFSSQVTQKANSLSSALLLIFLLAVPGLLIFLKAFWDYLVAYVALNSMTEGALMTGSVYDFQSHNEVATRRIFKYIRLWFYVAVLSIFATICCIIPIFGLIPPLIIWIYLILVFQVFTFEPDISAKQCFKRSFELIKGNWLRTFILMLILGFFSIFILSEGVKVILNYLDLTTNICSLFDGIGNSLDLSEVNRGLVHFHMKPITTRMISETIFSTIVGCIVAGLTLPVRSICWTLWYMGLAQSDGQKKAKDKTRKKNKNED